MLRNRDEFAEKTALASRILRVISAFWSPFAEGKSPKYKAPMYINFSTFSEDVYIGHVCCMSCAIFQVYHLNIFILKFFLSFLVFLFVFENVTFSIQLFALKEKNNF